MLKKRISNDLFYSSKQSSETVNHLASVKPPAEEPELRTIVPVHRTLCSVVPHIGVKACMEIMSCNADFIKNTTLYNMIGTHGVHINIARGKCLKSTSSEFVQNYICY